MQISIGLPRSALPTLEAPEVAMQSVYSVIVAELHGLCNYLVGNIVICVLGNVTNVQITLVKVCCLVTSNIIHVYMQYMDVSVCPYMMYMCCVGLPCCLFDLACLFLPSFSSLRKKK